MRSAKRYNSVNDWLLERFGERVYKVTLESYLTCPNRDGKLGFGGCIFCNLRSYDPATSLNSNIKVKSIHEQLTEGIQYAQKRHHAKKFISYFQSGTNTHAPAHSLRMLFHDAIERDDIAGLAVSTRPDCLDDEHTQLFKELSSKKMVWVELGLQSSHDPTLEKIERGHTVKDFITATERLSAAGIKVCAHIILGLPGENIEMMKQTARLLNRVKVWGVKIHNLHVLKDTKLELLYNEGKIKVPTLGEYANWAVDVLEELDPKIVIHRLNSHSPRAITVAPEWSINKLAIFNEIEHEMKKRKTRQGMNFSPDHNPPPKPLNFFCAS